MAKQLQRLKDSGFSLIELIVVIAGLSALTAVATPNVIRFVKEGQVDQAKALLNTAAAQCSSLIAQGISAGEAYPEALTRQRQDGAWEDKPLPGLYKYTGTRIDSTSQPSCTSLKLEDPSNDQSRLLTLEIGYDSAKKSFQKTATLKIDGGWSRQACENWGECIESAEAEERRRRREEIEARERAAAEARTRYHYWKAAGNSGRYQEDGYDKWVYKGEEVADEAAYMEAIGIEARERFEAWLAKGNSGNYTEDGLDKWAWRGTEVDSEVDFLNAKRDWEQKEFDAEVEKAKTANLKKKISKYGYTKWVFNGSEYNSEAEWSKAIAEATPKITPVNPYPPPVKTSPVNPVIGGTKDPRCSTLSFYMNNPKKCQ